MISPVSMSVNLFIFQSCAQMTTACQLSVCKLLLQGGTEAKTLTPKQCIVIDAGLETIKVFTSSRDIDMIFSFKYASL